MASGSPNRQSKTIETPGGSTITVGAGRGGTTTPGGVQVGGAGAGVVVQGPGGNTAARGRGAVGATDGTNSAFAAGSRAGISGAGGGTAVAGRGIRGATDGTNTAVRGGAFGAKQDRYGNTVAGARGGARVSDGRNVYGRGGAVGAIRGPAGNVIAGGRGAVAYNGRVVGAGQFRAVRSNFLGYGSYYTRGWYARYPGAWVARGIAAAAWWTGAYWNSAYDYCGCSSEPVSYDYGETVVYEDGNVYYGEEPVATAEQYFEQANNLAEAGEETSNEDWLPLGVFAVVSGDETQFDKVLQLAVNKEGVIRGNLNDKLTNQITSIEGSVDKKTQRAAFRPTKNPSMVAECGLYNLTQDALTVLVHLGKDRNETRKLIRLEEPEETEQ